MILVVQEVYNRMYSRAPLKRPSWKRAIPVVNKLSLQSLFLQLFLVLKRPLA
jgi:hypothetical protein